MKNFEKTQINQLPVGDRFAWLVNSIFWLIVKIDEGVVYFEGNGKTGQCAFDNANCKKLLS